VGNNGSYGSPHGLLGDGEMEWERELNAFQDNDLFKYFLFLNDIFVRWFLIKKSIMVLYS
jgi:hypothetical protein